jgi:hypothetical protein
MTFHPLAAASGCSYKVKEPFHPEDRLPTCSAATAADHG